MSLKLPERPLPFFIREGKIVQCSTATHSNDRDYHFDLLSFISIAQAFGVHFLNLTWQPALDALGRGASSTIQQAQIDAEFNLAFKRSIPWSMDYAADTRQQGVERYKAIIYELIALELLVKHPNVMDLIGITWETDGETEEVWPVLLTERSINGTMIDFARSEGSKLENRAKLSLCADVANACLVAHALGIVHGDIKAENVLIFPKGDSWIGKLIDFGFSCLGASDDDMVQVACTKPWQAPEHSQESYFPLEAARKMDVYSFGMLVCRVFLSEELSGHFDVFGELRDATALSAAIEQIEASKRTKEFAEIVKQELRNSTSLDEELKATLFRIFEMTLQHESKARVPDFEAVVALLSPGDNKEQKVATDFAAVERLSHTVLDIGELLADLDDTDYLLHRTLVRNLRQRTIKKPHCACFESATKQLSLCYEIGFGVIRNPEKAKLCWPKDINRYGSLAEYIQEIDKDYDIKRPDRLLKKLGYDTQLAFNPIELYQVQGRMDEAEIAFMHEVQGRKESMGAQSKSYISQLSTLGLLLSVKGDLEEAEKACRMAAKSSQLAYGEESSETISSQNYLANILFRRGRWKELEELQLQLIPIKLNSQKMGPKDATTLNSQNYLIVAYYFQGEYDQAIDAAQKLVAFRTDYLGPEHQETLVTTNWLYRSMLGKGDIEGLEPRMRDLVASSAKVCGADDFATLERKELLAAVILAQCNSPEPPLKKLEEAGLLLGEVLEACDSERNDNLLLILRAQTSLVCVLALEGELEDAENEIEDSRPTVEAIINAIGPDNVEVRRFMAIQLEVEGLLATGSFGGESVELSESRRRKLTHRWSLVLGETLETVTAHVSLV